MAEFRNHGTRNLPYPEYIRRRDEGRCFHCAGAYNPRHRFPEKNLRVIILVEDEKTPRNCWVGCKPNEVEEVTEERQPKEFDKCQHSDLSIFSARGMKSNQTMKLQGKVNKRSILVLIESGAGHNFVVVVLVQFLSLQVETTPPYSLQLGDGHQK